MKLAVNFSNPLVNLIKAKDIQVDLIKCPDWEGMLEEALPYGPVTIHFSLEAGLGIPSRPILSGLKNSSPKRTPPM